jgi:hypothetical protein
MGLQNKMVLPDTGWREERTGKKLKEKKNGKKEEIGGFWSTYQCRVVEIMLAEEASAVCGCVKHFIPLAENRKLEIMLI